MHSDTAEFCRPPWLPFAHAETIAAALGKHPRVDYERDIIKTRDQDEIVLDCVQGDAQEPLVVMFHGLEGCSQSRTLRVLARGFIDNRWSVAVPHFRSCGGHINRLPRAYHAADAVDVEWMIAYCRALIPHRRVFAVGVSLGGSALIHHLLGGDYRSAAGAAAVISTPFDLPVCVAKMDGDFLNRFFYARHFLKSLRPKIRQKARRYPDICNMKKLKAARTIGEFDEIYTAPVHGFKNAAAYWQHASTRDRLEEISTPLLCINALNDPLIPAHSLPVVKNPLVQCCRPRHGGHGGFIGNPKNWLFDTVHQFFQRHDSHGAPANSD